VAARGCARQGDLRFVNKLRSFKIDFSKSEHLKNWFRVLWILQVVGARPAHQEGLPWGSKISRKDRG